MLLLFGGGLAIANGFESTGLSKWLAGRLGGLAGSPATVVMGATCVIAVFASEIASNTALATLLMPILAVTAGGVGIAPVPLMVAGALAASCGFMLPVATAPNAIVYGTGQVPVRMMVKAGLLLDLIGIVLITAAGVALAMPILSR
jgi:sodium-dependent dicarboxylate transporter 2/3/5